MKKQMTPGEVKAIAQRLEQETRGCRGLSSMHHGDWTCAGTVRDTIVWQYERGPIFAVAARIQDYLYVFVFVQSCDTGFGRLETMDQVCEFVQECWLRHLSMLTVNEQNDFIIAGVVTQEELYAAVLLRLMRGGR